MNFESIKLGSIAKLVRGVTFARSDSYDEPHENFIPILRAGNIQSGKLYLNENLVYVHSSKVKDSQIICANDIVMCTSSGSPAIVGKCALALDNWNGSFGAFNVGIRANQNIIPSYLYYYLSSTKFKQWSSLSSGANIKNIRISELESFIIPLPPLSIQKKIVQVLDKAQQLIDLREKQIQLLDELVQSVFYDMFGDPVTNPKGWESFKLEDLTLQNTKISYGIVQPGDDINNGVPIVRPVDIKDDYIEIDNLKRTTVEIDSKFMKTKLSGNEILVSVRGSTGITYITDNSFQGFNITRGLAVIRPNNQVTIDYLNEYLRSEHSQRYIQENTKGATLRQINMLDLRILQVLVPPINLQEEFTDKVKKIESQKVLMQQSLDEMKNNYNSLMQRAFRGDLFSE